jgi:class 3 adenylate cyclase/tetratricopeptide (TPR) repeat protein
VLVRKTVTVLFCDVVTSSEHGERFDPESWRRVMSRYFDEMQAVIERHGGTVEKFIGDAVMAVFGVPVVHEDDALRAVRAAAEMRDRLDELNDELEETWGVRLEARIGVNTGEVVAGDPATGSTFVTGEAVNLAKRLEQAAGAGEILIGKATYPLVKDAVSAGPLESFRVKGKSQPVAPFRLDEVEAGVPGFARRLDVEMIGRQNELAFLKAAYEDAVDERRCRLLTVLGPGGIGKSRLAGELRAELGDATTWLTGRCLPYGDGITFWPLNQVLREAGGSEAAAAVLAESEDREAVSELLRATTGGNGVEAGSEEIFWAVRRFLEGLAGRKPLVVCLEDIHWAEPTFLDLVEYLAGWIAGAPVLLLCLARTDLLENRPSWANPRPNAALFSLEPLSGAEADTLLECLAGNLALDSRYRDRIAEAAEGNPLFVEQMVAMASEAPDSADQFEIPASIQALLAERLDRLGTAERSVIERASVAGKEFRRKEIVELSPPELRPSVGPLLMALVRKELIQPDTAAVAQDDGFRFRHALIRDAAYDGMPKEVRADLHERLAEYIEANAGERATELEDIRGYHLEQAHRFRKQLGASGGALAGLASRGAALLGSAGRRAFARGDMPAAVSLLTRASVLVAHDVRARLELAPDLGFALMEGGHLEQAEDVLGRALEEAAETGDHDAYAHALVGRGHLVAKTDPTGAVEELQRLADEAIARFGDTDDERGLAQAWRLEALAHSWRCRLAAMADALERALVYADRAADARERAVILHWLGVSVYYGPTPVDDAIEACEEMRHRTSDRTVQAMHTALSAGLLAMKGEFGEARERAARGVAQLHELGAVVKAGHARSFAADVELLSGDPVAAERELREGYETLKNAGDHNGALNTIFELAEALYAQDRLAEAEECVAIGSQERDRSDVMTRIVGMAIEAKLLARRGRLPEAEEMARGAVALAEDADAPSIRAAARLALGEVLAASGDDGAAREIETAARLLEEKGNVAAAAGARSLLGSPAARA